MAKIRGKFAPIYDELFYDDRFILKLNDFQKLMFLLLIYTAYMNENKCPISPMFYIRKYGIGTSDGQVTDGEWTDDGRVTDGQRKRVGRALDRIRTLFPKFKKCGDYLSFDNYVGYKKFKKTQDEECGQKVVGEIEKEIEEEKEIEQETDCDRLSDWKKIEQAYPNKASITKAMQSFFASVNLKAEVVLRAIEKYKIHLAANTWKKPMNLDRFLTELDTWINHVEPDKPKEVFRKPEGRSYDSDNAEFNKKLQEWKKEQATA